MKRPSRKTLIRATAIGTVGVVTIAALSGCSSNQIGSDAIGLYYTAGMFEGKGFDKVVESGTDFTVNDVVYQLPTSQRSWIIKNVEGADIKGYISVPSKDGLLIDFEASTAFKLNTLTDDLKDFKGGTARKFFEELCLHKQCYLDDNGLSPKGWKDLLLEKLHPALEAAFKDEARRFDADAIVNNTEVEVIPVDAKPGDTTKVKLGALTYLQQVIGKTFQTYLTRQTGASYFCGPTFDRETNKACGSVEMLINSADYNNPKVRESREAKKVAADQSAAEAELEKALSNPNYLEYLRIQAMNECTKNTAAVCVFDAGSGTSGVSVNTPQRK